MAKSNVRKFAFLKIFNNENKIFEGLAPICPAVRVIVKTETAMEVL